MRLVTIDRCQPGQIVGKQIYNVNGSVLLTKGSKLTERVIKRLKKLNVSTFYIEDELSEGIEILDIIPEELRIEAEITITEGFKTIAELHHNKANLQSMMKSGRAIRSFQKVFRDILDCLIDHYQALSLLATTKVYENHIFTHSLNVSIYSCQLGLENGLPLKQIEEIGLGAMLHDLGKMYVPQEILTKPGELTREEYELVQKHCELGFETLRKIHEFPLTAAHCAFQHHERMDGKGYPRGLKEHEIHKYAKIIGVCDVFDAVTSPRAYRPAYLPHQGIEILSAGAGTQFDANQVKAFKECIAIYPQGMTVKLDDGRAGIVTMYNYKAAGRPEIRIIRDEENQSIKPYEMDLAAEENMNIEIIEAAPLL